MYKIGCWTLLVVTASSSRIIAGRLALRLTRRTRPRHGNELPVRSYTWAIYLCGRNALPNVSTRRLETRLLSATSGLPARRGSVLCNLLAGLERVSMVFRHLGRHFSW